MDRRLVRLLPSNPTAHYNLACSLALVKQKAAALRSLQEAVKLATQRAHAGDAVLMSPACASFDMFRDYKHRAEVFCQGVHAVADDAGVVIEGDTR